MFDAKQLLSQYLEGQQASSGEKTINSGNLGGLAGGALAGGLTGLLAGTKTGRKIGKNALIYGGTALVGGLAYKACRTTSRLGLFALLRSTAGRTRACPGARNDRRGEGGWANRPG